MISPLAYVDPEAKLGKNVTVLPFAYIEKNVEIGDDCVIMSYASILQGTKNGKKETRYIRMLSSERNHKISTILEKKAA